eukprot:snap_masked-scaffold_6-processed-gene-4.25-mRNA-1 protein AED:1.00 eAED:1.00 QI:0/-1/0/0/-1/1/1/0/81
MLNSKFGVCALLVGFHFLVTMNYVSEEEQKEIGKGFRCTEADLSCRKKQNLNVMNEFSKYKGLSKSELVEAMKESYLLQTE